MSVAAQVRLGRRLRGPRRALRRAVAHRTARRPRRVGGGARRPRVHAAAGPQPAEAGRRGGRRARRRRRRRADPAALAVLPRLRDARLHPAPSPRRHRRRQGEPPAAALRGDRRPGARAGVGAPPRRRPVARARPRRVAARGVPRLERPLDALGRRRPPRLDPSRRLSAPLRAARRRLRAPAVARPLADMALGGARRHGALLRRGRRLPVVHARRLLESEREGLQRLRAVLPRQLGVLGPVGVRALPDRRHPRLARRDPARRRSRLARRRALRGRVATWLGLLISFSQSSFVALAAGIVVATAVAWGRRATLGLVALGAATTVVLLAVPQVRHELVGKSRSGVNRITSGRANLVGEGIRITLDHPVARRRRRRLLARVPAPAPHPGQGPEARRVPHDAGHGRGRARSRRARPARAGSWLAALLATLHGLGRGFTSRVALATGVVLARDRRAQPLLRGVLRGPDDVGAARARRPQLAGAAEARRLRRCARRPRRPTRPWRSPRRPRRHRLAPCSTA